ncbi:MAG: hypothetical protein QXF12_03625 [Candidatus Aenigmatarchaeota archaeon]
MKKKDILNILKTIRDIYYNNRDVDKIKEYTSLLWRRSKEYRDMYIKEVKEIMKEPALEYKIYVEKGLVTLYICKIDNSCDDLVYCHVPEDFSSKFSYELTLIPMELEGDRLIIKKEYGGVDYRKWSPYNPSDHKDENKDKENVKSAMESAEIFMEKEAREIADNFSIKDERIIEYLARSLLNTRYKFIPVYVKNAIKRIKILTENGLDSMEKCIKEPKKAFDALGIEWSELVDKNIAKKVINSALEGYELDSINYDLEISIKDKKDKMLSDEGCFKFKPFENLKDILKL